MDLSVYRNLTVNMQVYETHNKSDGDIEMFVISVQQKCTKPFIVISVYRPPQGSQTTYVNAIRNVLKSIAGGNKVLLMGDFNIDYRITTCEAVQDSNSRVNFSSNKYVIQLGPV